MITSVTEFIRNNFCDVEFREICYFCSEIMNALPENDMFFKFSTDKQLELYITALQITVTFYTEEGKIVALRFCKLSYMTYDYFIKKNSNEFTVFICSIPLEKVKSIFFSHIHGSHIEMFTFMKNLFSAEIDISNKLKAYDENCDIGHSA